MHQQLLVAQGFVLHTLYESKSLLWSTIVKTKNKQSKSYHLWTLQLLLLNNTSKKYTATDLREWNWSEQYLSSQDTEYHREAVSRSGGWLEEPSSLGIESTYNMNHSMSGSHFDTIDNESLRPTLHRNNGGIPTSSIESRFILLMAFLNWVILELQ